MTDRISPSVPGASLQVQPSPSSPTRSGASHRPESTPSTSFAEALREAAGSLSEGQTRIDRAIRRGSRGETDPGHLLALQAGVYRYTQELELASKLVDKATGALKQTLQSQQ